jgi:hypothetical protein
MGDGVTGAYQPRVKPWVLSADHCGVPLGHGVLRASPSAVSRSTQFFMIAGNGCITHTYRIVPQAPVACYGSKVLTI